MFRSLCLLIGLSLPGILQAQSRLDCPRPVRQPRYRIAPKPYLEIGAGFSRPVLYRNAAGGAGAHHRFISRLTPYASAIAFLPLSERVAVFAGAAVTQIWQGLRFDYTDGNGTFTVKSYSGSFVASLPLGIRYRAGERLLLDAGPYLSYASHSGQTEASQGSGSGGTTARYTYTSPDDRGLNVGLRLAANVNLTRRLSLAMSCAADALPSAAGYSRADLGNRSEQVYEGRMEPQLLHAGFGLSYRIGAVSGE